MAAQGHGHIAGTPLPLGQTYICGTLLSPKTEVFSPYGHVWITVSHTCLQSSKGIWCGSTDFDRFLPCTDGIFIIPEDIREPICLFMGACMSGRGAVSWTEAYHMEVPPHPHIQQQSLSICHLELWNAIVAVKMWVPQFANRLIHILSDNATAVAILQAGKWRDSFLQSCTREVWLSCATWDITLAVGHVHGIAGCIWARHSGTKLRCY